MFGNYFGGGYFGDGFFGPSAATGDATASGQLLTATASLIAGQATGTGQASGSGGGRGRGRRGIFAPTVFAPTVEIIIDRLVPGELLVAYAQLIPGKASGGVTANGALLIANSDLAAGRASGSSVQAGVQIVVGARVAEVGAASGVDNFARDNDFMLAA